MSSYNKSTEQFAKQTVPQALTTRPKPQLATGTEQASTDPCKKKSIPMGPPMKGFWCCTGMMGKLVSGGPAPGAIPPSTALGIP